GISAPIRNQPSPSAGLTQILPAASALTKSPGQLTRIRTLSLSLLLAVVVAGLATAAPNKPKSVIHVITIQWKADATPEQIQQAIRAAENINYPGIKNVWTKPIKMQLPEGYKHIIVMEF